MGEFLRHARRVAHSRLSRPSAARRPFAVGLLAELIGSTRRYFLAAIAISLAQEGVDLPPALRDAIGGAVRFYLADGEADRGSNRALDEPFVVGDVLTIDTLTGKVERVGIKTTRLRADSGEQIVLSNADILKSRVRNFARAAEAPAAATRRPRCST